ncbi:hypothetical protein NQ315_000828 [Exocentrus adspersus]|uniref:Serine protease K12H4.7 n=1 Tax=Exocentrus adspersus TaxID=1586481 RepID=A0AAV8WDJ2_9CUCU|nr:hypothetical protein NQ315_000828 [Exocentrus adspersus]
MVDLCRIMTDKYEGKEMYRLARTVDYVYGSRGLDKCTDSNYRDYIQPFKNITADENKRKRQWLYQTCTEFGWFQTSTTKEKVFGEGYSVEYFSNICTEVFGPEFNASFTTERIELTNAKYGGLDINVTNVVFVHGDRDPWHPVGLFKENTPESPVIIMKGISHCANMYDELRNEWPEVASAKKQVAVGHSLGNDIPPPKTVASRAEVTTHEFMQSLDHFDPSNKIHWAQRYYVNTEYFNSTGENVAFLLIAGEGEASTAWMTGGAWIETAQKYKALLFELEHRFYGQSHPFPDLSTENLRYLSSRQALEDTANFITAMNREYNLTDAKWIVFGGSYAGSLAAWLRQKYPHLVQGAMSASGPLSAQLDFPEYLDVVAADLALSSQECVNVVKTAYDQLEDLITNPGDENLTSLFNLCDDIDAGTTELDIVNLFELLTDDIFAYVAQYNKNSGRTISVDDLCDILTNQTYGNEVHRLAEVNKLFYGSSCLDYKYQNTVNYLSNTSVTPSGNMRQWIYQTCTEYGWYQSSNQEEPVFGNRIPLDFFTGLCEDVYGPEFNVTYTSDRINRINTHFGGYDIDVRNVVFVHGSFDPWYPMGLTKTVDPESPVIFINGTAHCANMYDVSDGDLPQLVEARKEVNRLIGVWLGVEQTSGAGSCLAVSLISTHVLSFRTIFRGHFVGNDIPPPKTVVSRAEVSTHQFVQSLDHFDPSNTNLWLQRYYVNAEYFNATQGNVAFLMIAGEGEASVGWMTGGAWIETAQKYGALLFELEHRFYGESHPFSDLSTPNLRYLSSRQALEDTANFITAMNQEYNLTEPKWILFGGSYAGSLAAWLRQKYPHLVQGAMSASGPLLAQLDFPEYYKVVVADLASHSQECVSVLKTAFDQIEATINNTSNENITSLFNLCDDIQDVTNTESDISTLFEGIATIFAYIAQYNKNSGRTVSVDDLCDILVNEDLGTEIYRLAEVNKIFYSSSCLDFKYQSSVDYLKDTTITPSGNMRQWIYQTCTEYGWYQTSSQEEQVFGTRFPIDFYTKLCEDVYGPEFNATYISDQIDRLNTHFGGYDIDVKNVVFVHGSFDPWHPMGLTETTNPESPVIFINGTAHCANMYSISNSDLPQLTEAREEINRLIGVWLGVEQTSGSAKVFTASILNNMLFMLVTGLVFKLIQ